MRPSIHLRSKDQAIARRPLELIFAHRKTRKRIQFSRARFPYLSTFARCHIEDANRPGLYPFGVFRESVGDIEQSNVGYAFAIGRPARLNVAVYAWLKEFYLLSLRVEDSNETMVAARGDESE